MVYDRYLTIRYVCVICMICVVYIPNFLHLYYTYRVSDICVFVKYHTHFIHISDTYRVPDRYPITSISTSDCKNGTILALCMYLIQQLRNGKWIAKYLTSR